MIYKGFEAVIGLEVHVELKTATKAFCACSTAFGAPPNTAVCPVCMGLPGALPVLNARAVELTMRAGLATACRVAPYTRFDRKNYSYPDLPKGYQISQQEYPLCTDGHLMIAINGVKKRIGITRIHLEEDAGKLLHEDGRTLVDHNRCGVPLAEIVSAPDLRSADEAKAYLQTLRTVLRFAGVSDCRMQEGALRCDVNLSVRRVGCAALGTRTEMKNLNSFRFVARAIEHEFRRQVDLLLSGGTVVQETRRYDPDTDNTYAMRTKESAADYRFFPEPDLLPLAIREDEIAALAADMPVMPPERCARYQHAWGVPAADAEILSSDRALADYFEAAAAATPYPRIAASLLVTEGLRATGAEDFATPAAPCHLAELATLLGDEQINSSTAKKLAGELFASDFSPRAAVTARGLLQINDEVALAATVAEAIAENPRALADYRAGKRAARAALVGAAMAKTRGRANPRLLSELLDRALEE